MTLEELKVPVSERVLRIESRVSPEALQRVASGIGVDLLSRDVALFAQFAYADVPLGKRFDRCYRSTEYADAVAVGASLLAVTQQFGKPFDGIPHGWKTVIVLRFDDEVPELVASLPVAEFWYEHPVSVYIATTEAWEALRGASAK